MKVKCGFGEYWTNVALGSQPPLILGTAQIIGHLLQRGSTQGGRAGFQALLQSLLPSVLASFLRRSHSELKVAAQALEAKL